MFGTFGTSFSEVQAIIHWFSSISKGYDPSRGLPCNIQSGIHLAHLMHILAFSSDGLQICFATSENKTVLWRICIGECVFPMKHLFNFKWLNCHNMFIKHKSLPQESWDLKSLVVFVRPKKRPAKNRPHLFCTRWAPSRWLQVEGHGAAIGWTNPGYPVICIHENMGHHKPIRLTRSGPPCRA